MYKNFVEPFDAHDNGRNRYPDDAQPFYARPFDIFRQVALLNPAWDDNSKLPMDQFWKAVKVCRKAFMMVLDETIGVEKQRAVYKAAIEKSIGDYGIACKFLILECPCTAWDPLFELEAQHGLSGHFLYVITEDQRAGQWKINCISIKAGDFRSRKLLPTAWCGLNANLLDENTGVPGGIFVHRAGFVGAHSTFEGALQLAQFAINS